MDLSKCSIGGSTPQEMDAGTYAYALLDHTGGWFLSGFERGGLLDDAGDVAAARESLAEPERIPYGEVRRKLGL